MSLEASDGRWWKLTLAPGWMVATADVAPIHFPWFEVDRCVALVSPFRDAAMRMYPWDSREHDQPAAQWVKSQTSWAESQGSTVTPWRSDGFTGTHARDVFNGAWFTDWWLAAGPIALDALYRYKGQQSIGNRDEADLTAMIRTLEFLGAAV